MEHPLSETRPARILIVDDSPATREVLERNLVAEGYHVFTAPGVAEALHLLDNASVELVVTDLVMPKSDGLTLVRHVRENLKDTEIMMITGYPSIEGAVQAVKSGVEEYLAKPFTDEELLAAVRRALEKLRMRRAGCTPTEGLAGMPHGIIGDAPSMQAVFSAIAKAASATATVLVAGESGTGKELVARAIHYSSPRSAAPFIPVNCGGIPEGLLESALFGHVKGAFTGATESRAGFFHAADGGTIFLDEVSETSPAMQVKLLRVLEAREIYMVGSNRTRKVDVRVVAATNKDLGSLVKKGTFRDDLYYRLNVIPIALPPLRERGDDVLLLTNHFLARCAGELDKPPVRFSGEALQALRAYDWPGNVRELENVVKRLVLMAESDVIEVVDLPSLMRVATARDSGLDRSLADVEAQHVRNVLASVGGNKSQAAKILGIDRKTLRQKLRQPE